jgi:hypothetical protein
MSTEVRGSTLRRLDEATVATDRADGAVQAALRFLARAAASGCDGELLASVASEALAAYAASADAAVAMRLASEAVQRADWARADEHLAASFDHTADALRLADHAIERLP